MTIGQKITLLRESLGISQKELAKALNVSPSSISNYETDYRKPKYDVAYKIADYFDCEVGYLIETRSREERDTVSPSVLAIYYTKLFNEKPELLKLLQTCDDLPKETIEKIIKVITVIR